MTISKIIRVIAPEYPNGLFEVYFEHMPNQKVMMSLRKFEMMSFESKLVEKGIEVEDLLRYRQHIVTWCEDEFEKDLDCLN